MNNILSSKFIQMNGNMNMTQNQKQQLPLQDQFSSSTIFYNQNGLDHPMLNQNQPFQIQKQHQLSQEIVEVYRDNFFQEMEKLAELIEQYNYIAMDTEFPGDVFFGNTQYQIVKENVNHLKLIQLGITISNEDGEYPKPYSTWQFNFKFRLEDEHKNEKSIQLLIDSGIDFDRLQVEGIEHSQFSEYFLQSGLIMNQKVHWYGFHTDHDFGYLLRILTGHLLPPTELQFMNQLNLVFPNLYDIKVIADNNFGYFRSSLAILAERLQVQRDDNCEHQAGSDSKITAKCFFELKKMQDDCIELSKGEIFGINKIDTGINNFTNQQNTLPIGNSIQNPKEEQKINQNQVHNNSGILQQLNEKNIDNDYENQFNENVYDEDHENFIQEEEQENQNTLLQKQQYLMMHPGLAAQFSSQQNYFPEYQPVQEQFQTQQNEQQIMYQQYIQNMKGAQNYPIQYNQNLNGSNGYSTPTTIGTPQPHLHQLNIQNMQAQQLLQIQQQQYQQILMQQQYQNYYMDNRKSPQMFPLYRQSPNHQMQ